MSNNMGKGTFLERTYCSCCKIVVDDDVVKALHNTETVPVLYGTVGDVVRATIILDKIIINSRKIT